MTGKWGINAWAKRFWCGKSIFFFFESKEEEILHRFTVRFFQNDAVSTILSHFCRGTFFWKISKIVKKLEKNAKNTEKMQKMSEKYRFRLVFVRKTKKRSIKVVPLESPWEKLQNASIPTKIRAILPMLAPFWSSYPREGQLLVFFKYEKKVGKFMF